MILSFLAGHSLEGLFYGNEDQPAIGQFDLKAFFVLKVGYYLAVSIINTQIQRQLLSTVTF